MKKHLNQITAAFAAFALTFGLLAAVAPSALAGPVGGPVLSVSCDTNVTEAASTATNTQEYGQALLDNLTITRGATDSVVVIIRDAQANICYSNTLVGSPLVTRAVPRFPLTDVNGTSLATTTTVATNGATTITTASPLYTMHNFSGGLKLTAWNAGRTSQTVRANVQLQR